MRKPFSLYHPWLYAVRVWQRRLFRHFQWHFFGKKYSLDRYPQEALAFRYIRHTSKLIRKLGDSDILLQQNKVTNLKIAVEAINGVHLLPGEYFSFCRLVGQPTAKKGYLEGMELSFGEARQGIGGGLCQLSNLIHWMALHSPLRVVERANHSFDPFPDEGRVLPFGSGAAIFYNFVDLVLHNPTDSTFQILCHVGEHQLEGELRCKQERPVNYHIYQKNHRFLRHGNMVLRENEIWRDKHSKGHHPKLLSSECLYSNRVIVKYAVADEVLDVE